MSYLCPQVIVKQFESGKLFVHGLGVLRLLFLHNLATCFYHRLHLQLYLTQQLVQFLHSKKKNILSVLSPQNTLDYLQDKRFW